MLSRPARVNAEQRYGRVSRMCYCQLLSGEKGAAFVSPRPVCMGSTSVAVCVRPRDYSRPRDYTVPASVGVKLTVRACDPSPRPGGSSRRFWAAARGGGLTVPFSPELAGVSGGHLTFGFFLSTLLKDTSCQRSEWASEASRDRADAEILLGAVPLGFAITLDDGADQH